MEENRNMMGRVVRIVRDRGFGFIQPDGEETASHFFHAFGIAKAARSFEDLQEGDRVSFTQVLGGEKGPRAKDVRAID